MAFLAVSWGGAAGVLLSEWIFSHEVVSAGRGVAGPKEWMGLVGAVTDCRAYVISVRKRNGRNKFLVLVVKTLFTTHSTPNCIAIN